MKKLLRNLDGVYFRVQNQETGKWENICFSDLDDNEMDKVMEDRTGEWLISLHDRLVDVIKEIKTQFDLDVAVPSNIPPEEATYEGGKLIPTIKIMCKMAAWELRAIGDECGIMCE